jgi:hypothetical protein
VRKTQSEDVRLLVALTNLLLSQLADLRKLRAGSEAAARPLTELLDGIADGVNQTANEVTACLSRALAAEGYPPSETAAGNVGRPRRGADEGPWIRGFS